MTKTIVVKPLGLVLRKAGLVSSEQIEKALKESLLLPQCKIGEILAIRGLIKPQTADFFAEVWPHLLKSKKIQPLGEYLQAASLINDQQVKQILNIQSHNSLKFGKIAVEQGLISQSTLDFFLEHLNLIKNEEKINIYPEKIALELDRIEKQLLKNQKCEALQILTYYNKIRQQGKIVAQGNLVERELLASGIVVLKDNLIEITNPNYSEVFNEDWVEKELAKLQPYNQIRLKLFNIENKADIPYKILNAVNRWTDHQPLLTQKLYQLIREKSTYINPGQEELVIEELTYKYIIDNWHKGAAAQHFKNIQDRIINNEFCSAIKLLESYKKVWRLKEVKEDFSPEQKELLDIGLIKLKHNIISVSNLIYQAVFDLPWIENQLQIAKQLNNTNNQTAAKAMVENEIPTTTSNFIPQKKSHKSFVQIIVIAVSLISIPLFYNLVEGRSQPDQLIEQGNSLSEQPLYNNF